MEQQRFFRTTRGRIVTELRRVQRATAGELATRFGLTANAIRQHLSVLVEDGLVRESSVRRGPTKPTNEYALTSEADLLFPQRYDRLLNAVLREMREKLGDEAVAMIFSGIAERSRARFAGRLSGRTQLERVEQLAEILREHGVETSVEQPSTDLIVLYERNCPYSKSVSSHPEVCMIVHSLLDTAAVGQVRKTASLADGAGACRFEISGASQRETV